MSREALADYERARGEQQSRNEARGIRRGIRQARQNPVTSAFRWPFELLQNALDAGPRPHAEQVSITVRRTPTAITFAHDGMPFSARDLAALLSGGSNKDFDSDTTTGRFGTGFLSTHALSDRLTLEGLLSSDGRFEHFNLDIDRRGDEEDILANTAACNAAIAEANAVDVIQHLPSAQFEYPIEQGDIADLGLQAFHQALPYLYATRESLGRAEIDWQDQAEIWSASSIASEAFEDGIVYRRVVRIDSTSGSKELLVYWFAHEPGQAHAITVVQSLGDSVRVILPKASDRRIFRDYPLEASTFVPIPFVLNGKFEPDTERIGLSLDENNERVLHQALSGAVLAIKFATVNQWLNAHWLAAVHKPTAAFHADGSDLESWTEILKAYAQRLSELPLVATREGMLPASDQAPAYADFAVPRLTAATTADETDHDRMWSLLDGTSSLYPPHPELSAAWTEIAYGWRSLDVFANMIAAKDVVQYVKGDGDSLADLSLQIDPVDWLTQFLDVLGECREKSSADVEECLANLLPNQNQKLRSPSALKIDDGVPDALKDICNDVKLDVRDGLLFRDLQTRAQARGLTHVAPLLNKVVSQTATEDDVIAQLTEVLDDALPDGEECKDAAAARATAKLIEFLLMRRGDSAAEVAKEIPLITSEGTAVRWNPDRKMMAPVRYWPEVARPFFDVYTPARILSELYCGDEDETPQCVEALVRWGLAFAEPLTRTHLAELKERRLFALAPGQDVQGVTVAHVDLANIALLAPDVLNRCANSLDYARHLLGLILCYVLGRDSSWRAEQQVVGHRGGKACLLNIRPTLWLADLKIRAWVPREVEDETLEQAQANATTLQDLLDPAWLRDGGDAIQFLSTCFGFDALDLQFLGIEDDIARKSLRDELARLVHVVGTDPEIYQALVRAIDERARRGRDVERARRLGTAIEQAIRHLLEASGLKVKFVDRGFDFEVMTSTDDFFADFGREYEIGSCLLEVKATTTGSARMTPLQAQTASKTTERYVLCVVDLRDMPEAALDEEWTPQRVEALARFIPNIGRDVKETWDLIDEAAGTNAVRIRNESALRYEVPPSLWEGGISMRDWVESLRS